MLAGTLAFCPPGPLPYSGHFLSLIDYLPLWKWLPQSAGFFLQTSVYLGVDADLLTNQRAAAVAVLASWALCLYQLALCSVCTICALLRYHVFVGSVLCLCCLLAVSVLGLCYLCVVYMLALCWNCAVSMLALR